jgi:hypothetical protein
MGIDRVGKSEPFVPVPETSGSSKTLPAGQAFQVPKPAATAAPQEVKSETSRSPLDRLRAGEIDASGYVNLKVDEATSHLSGLPRVELDSIREALREHLATDPELAHLVRTAVGDGSPPLDD